MTAVVVPTLPLVLKRDELALKLYKDRNSPHSGVLSVMKQAGGELETRRMPDGLQGYMMAGLSAHLQDAHIVVWRPDLLDAASSGYTAFLGTSLPLSALPTVPQYWPGETLTKSFVWRTLLGLNKSEDGHKVSMHGILVFGAFDGWEEHRRFADRYNISYDKGEPDPQPVLHTCVIATVNNRPRILTVPVEVGSVFQKAQVVAWPVIAGLMFMQQTFVTKQTFRYPRRNGASRQQYIPVVHQVVLRARESQVVPGSHADSESDREWEHSWTVRGHWRKLHRPRKADGVQVTWVTPYVKGDLDKPLLPPRDTVVRVSR